MTAGTESSFTSVLLPFDPQAQSPDDVASSISIEEGGRSVTLVTGAVRVAAEIGAGGSWKVKRSAIGLE